MGMSTRYAVLEGNDVVNVVLWDGETSLDLSGTLISCEGLPVGPGWKYLEGQWVEPVREETEVDDDRSYAEKRYEAYLAESDTLGWKWLRGEIEDKQVWLDKVEEIRQRYPK